MSYITQKFTFISRFFFKLHKKQETKNDGLNQGEIILQKKFMTVTSLHVFDTPMEISNIYIISRLYTQRGKAEHTKWRNVILNPLLHESQELNV